MILLSCEVEFLNKNIRYRMIKNQNDYYLLDMETSIWSVLFPFIFWFMPQKVYKVDSKTAEKMKAPTLDSKKFMYILLLSIVVQVFLVYFSKDLLNFVISTSLLANILIVTVSSLIIIYLRYLHHKTLQKKLSQHVMIENISCERVKIKPKLVQNYFIAMLGYFMFTVFVVLGVYIFLTYGTFIGILCFIIMFPIFLITHLAVLSAGPAIITYC
mgnify:CR=1 FL=1